MNIEQRLQRLEQQHRSYHALLKKLITMEVTHRALLLSLLDQRNLNHKQLFQDFDLYLNQILEQIHPSDRDDTYLQQFLDEVERRRGGPLSPAP